MEGHGRLSFPADESPIPPADQARTQPQHSDHPETSRLLPTDILLNRKLQVPAKNHNGLGVLLIAIQQRLHPRYEAIDETEFIGSFDLDGLNDLGCQNETTPEKKTGEQNGHFARRVWRQSSNWEREKTRR